MSSTKFSVKAIAAIFFVLSASVNAHMIMSNPIPYGKSTLDNSPLIADGSDFPCKQRTGVYDLEGASNTMAIGDTQTLSFIGSAVHGGGSCQVSLTTDQQPTKDSQFQVIHSIIGNCPSNVTGNLDTDATGTGATVFEYTIPEGIAPGQYTIAWSWVNKVGNREFYMNCGPATITAAKKKRYAPAPKVRRQSSFPPMFVANLAGVSNGCVTPETVDIVYPQPGDSVQSGSIGVSFAPPQSCTGAAAVAATGSASAAAVTSAASAPAESSAAASAASAPAGSSAPADATGSFASGSAAASAASLATSTAVVSPIPAETSAAGAAPSASVTSAAGAAPSVSAAPVASAAPSASASGAAPASSGTTSTTGAQSGACTDEGEWYCSTDGSSFQRCASGMWSAPMAMAAGTTCTPGMSSSLAMTADKAKRFSKPIHWTDRRSNVVRT